MNLNDIPLFSMMKARMGYITAREKVISQNVANVDTPAFIPKDLKPFTLSGPGTQGTGPGQLAMALPSGSGALTPGGQLAMVQPAQTNPAHLSGNPDSDSGEWKPITNPDSETKIDGNQVVIEDQMGKMTESRMDYQAVVGFYEKAMDMLKMAGTAPGK